MRLDAAAVRALNLLPSTVEGMDFHERVVSVCLNVKLFSIFATIEKYNSTNKHIFADHNCNFRF